MALLSESGAREQELVRLDIVRSNTPISSLFLHGFTERRRTEAVRGRAGLAQFSGANRKDVLDFRGNFRANPAQAVSTLGQSHCIKAESAQQDIQPDVDHITLWGI